VALAVASIREALVVVRWLKKVDMYSHISLQKAVSASALAAMLLSLGGCASDSSIAPKSVGPSNGSAKLFERPNTPLDTLLIGTSSLTCGQGPVVTFSASGYAYGTTVPGTFTAKGSWQWSSATNLWVFSESFYIYSRGVTYRGSMFGRRSAENGSCTKFKARNIMYGIILRTISGKGTVNIGDGKFSESLD
jgi:hypothetical protein